MDCNCCGQRLTQKALNTHATGWTGREIAGTHTCQNCGAVMGTVYLGEFYEIVKPYWSKADPPQERWVYYDFMTLGSEGERRYHGWFDRETRLILQTG